MLSRFLDEYVVCDGIPGVMNADEEQQQRYASNAEQDLARAGRR